MFTHNYDMTHKAPTLWYSVGDFYVTLLTSRSFLRHAQSLNCAHDGLKEQLLTCQLQDCEPRWLVEKALCCRWPTAPSVDVSSTAQVVPPGPGSARRTLVGLCQYGRCFLHPELCFSSTLQVSDYDMRDCGFQATTFSTFCLCLFTLQIQIIKIEYRHLSLCLVRRLHIYLHNRRQFPHTHIHTQVHRPDTHTHTLRPLD